LGSHLADDSADTVRSMHSSQAAQRSRKFDVDWSTRLL